MADEIQRPRLVPNAVWRAEQQATQDAYAAKRRAWMHAFERRAMPTTDDEAEPPAAEIERSAAPARRGRTRGVVHDPRQAKFDL